MSLFSIIVPIYNVAPWLDEALESLLAQTETSWEGLCIDDGSTDDSGEKLLAYVRKDPRLRATFQPNGGVSDARNRALRMACGRWTGCFDADDVVAPDWLAEAKRCFNKTQVDLVCFDYVDWEKVTRAKAKLATTSRVFRGRQEVQNWGWYHFLYGAYPWRYFVRRELSVQCTFSPKLTIKEDCIYGYTLLPLLTSVYKSNAKLYFYRRRTTSALHAPFSIDGTLQLFKEVERLYALSCDDSTITKVKCDALAKFTLQAFLDWAISPRREERDRYDEMRVAFSQIIDGRIFTFKEVVRWHWHPSVRIALKFGWLFPIRMHNFFLSYF